MVFSLYLLDNRPNKMKKLLLLTLSIISTYLSAQTYSSQNINLLGMIHPNSGTVGIGTDDRRYAGCWGWKQPVTNKEYAIVGSSSGTYFIDITNPTSPTVSAFVSGKPNCTWREIKTYQNYCYVVSDDGSPNTFQIIDMAQLPSTVTVVHNGVTYFERGHTIFIDGDNMYIGSTTYSAGNSPAYSSMNVYSLLTPTAPLFLRSLATDYPSIATVHDMYVNNDTVFASCGNQGLYMYRYNASTVSFSLLGSYTGYPGAGYNHSSWMTADKKHLVFCDEVPTQLSIKLVNIQNFANVQPVQTMKPHANTTAHNPYVVGNNFAFVACYQDGLNIYNIATPANPFLAGFFDTHPQGGFNVNNYFGADYRGNWGAYPYLPSGVVIAVDMQNGIFLLDPANAFLNTGIKSNAISNSNLIVYPNPASDKISVNYNTANHSVVQIKNMVGQTVFEKEFIGNIHNYIDVDKFANGTYIMSLTENNQTVTKKLIVNH